MVQLSRFDYGFRTNFEAFEHAVRNAPHLDAKHGALIKAGFEMAQTLDSLQMGRDPRTGRIVIGRLHASYLEVLKNLGLRYGEVVGAQGSEDAPEVAAAAAPVASLDMLRAAAAAAGS